MRSNLVIHMLSLLERRNKCLLCAISTSMAINGHTGVEQSSLQVISRYQKEQHISSTHLWSQSLIREEGTLQHCFHTFTVYPSLRSLNTLVLYGKMLADTA